MKLALRRIALPLASFTLELDAEITGNVCALFGPSGAGKTSLLDLIAGLRKPRSAFIELDGETLTDTDRGVCIPVPKRRIGYVPQDGALFPHMSVRHNLLYGRKPGGEDGKFSFEHITEVLDIRELADRGIGNLSGGEKQRVALARALLASPRLLLLDEPLTGLDLSLRARVLPYLQRVRDEFAVPMLYVTHNLSEVLALCDSMHVIHEGRIVQSGKPIDVFNAPQSLTVARAVGTENIFVGKVVRHSPEAGLTSIDLGGTQVDAAYNAQPVGSPVTLGIRSEDIIVATERIMNTSARNVLEGTIRHIQRDAEKTELVVNCGIDFKVSITAGTITALQLATGKRVYLLMKARAFHLLT